MNTFGDMFLYTLTGANNIIYISNFKIVLDSQFILENYQILTIQGHEFLVGRDPIYSSFLIAYHSS